MSYRISFEKPKDIRIVDMCIYVDNHIYDPACTEAEKNTIFKYIYFIIYSLTCKGKYFKNIHDYDDFSLFAASKVYLRLVDRRQFNPQPNERKLDVIKSVLNYIKLTLLGMRVDYQNDNFRQVLGGEVDTRFNSDAYNERIRESIQEDYNSGLPDAIVDDLRCIPNIIKSELDRSPYRKNQIIYHNLYISCMITLLKSITLSNDNLDKLKKKEINNSTKLNELTEKCYKQEKENSGTVWHLDPGMIDYVNILCNKIKMKIGDILRDTKSSFEINDSDMTAIIKSAYDTQFIVGDNKQND